MTGHRKIGFSLLIGCVLLVALAFAIGARSRHSQPPPQDWRREIKPHVVTSDEVQTDPERAARKAIASEDWRLIAFPQSGSADTIPGLVCSVPLEVRELATISYWLRDLRPFGWSDSRAIIVPQPDGAAIATFNRIVAAAQDSPWRGLCVDAK